MQGQATSPHEPDEFLTAEQAARVLGVTRPTLYAYVSRGLLTSRFPDVGARERRYAARDVQALLNRRAARADPEALVRRALYGDTPVLHTSISVWADGALFYRGRCVSGLAKRHSIEHVATLLWVGDHHAHTTQSLFPRTIRPAKVRTEPVESIRDPLEAARALIEVTLDDLTRPVLRWDVSGLAEAAARWLDRLAQRLSGETASTEAVATHLQRAFPSAVSTRVLDAVLILGADAPMDATTLAVRGIASTRTHPLAAVLAGLTAALGEWASTDLDAVHHLLDEAMDPSTAPRPKGSRRGAQVTPEGDPRAVALWALTRELFPGPTFTTIATAVRQRGAPLTLPLALSTLERVSGLPRGAGFPIWLLGRSVGWMAHVIEQSTQGTMRPAARYEGEAPDSIAP